MAHWKHIVIEHHFKNSYLTENAIVCSNCKNKPLRDREIDMLYFSMYCPFCGKRMEDISER